MAAVRSPLRRKPTRSRATAAGSIAFFALALLAGPHPEARQEPGVQGGGRGQRPAGRGAAERPAQPRDAETGRQIAPGTATVSGTVFVTGTGQPARRARVMLNATEGARSRTMVADENGRFAFEGVVAGRYTLSASKTGHVGVTFGQTQPGRPGTPIQLRDGEKFAADLQLPRGSVITGTVVDEFGEPTPGIQVRVLRAVVQAGRALRQQSGTGSTDDRGIYRIFGLQPGTYIVSAIPRNTGPGPDMPRLQAELEAVRERMALAGAEIGAASPLAIRAGLLEGQMPAAEEQGTGYAPVFYPGTTSANEAAPIALGVGEERASVDFQLQRIPLAVVEGVVVNSTGTPGLDIQLTLTSSGQALPWIGSGNARADAEGRFRLTNVAPGNYKLLALGRAGSIEFSVAGGPGPFAGRGGRGRGGQPPPLRFWGSVDVPVDGRNLSNVVVTLQPGLTVSGRIVFDGATAPPADLTRLRVTLSPSDPAAARELAPPAAGTVDASGKFTIHSVVPGVYRLNAAGAGGGWTLESSVVDGRDSLDFPFEVKPGSVPTSAVVTFSDRASQLSGTLTDQRGQPAPGFTLILFAADERYWVPQSRRIRSARPDTAGVYTFASVPPGDYKLAALADVEPGAWFDPSFLQQLDAASTHIVIGEADKKVQNLQVAVSQ